MRRAAVEAAAGVRELAACAAVALMTHARRLRRQRAHRPRATQWVTSLCLWRAAAQRHQACAAVRARERAARIWKRIASENVYSAAKAALERCAPCRRVWASTSPQWWPRRCAEDNVLRRRREVRERMPANGARRGIGPVPAYGMVASWQTSHSPLTLLTTLTADQTAKRHACHLAKLMEAARAVK